MTVRMAALLFYQVDVGKGGNSREGSGLKCGETPYGRSEGKEPSLPA